MKSFLTIVLFSFIVFNCGSKTQQNEIEYVKVVTFYTPDTITTYNKGIGLGDFAYFEPKKDSFLYRSMSLTGTDDLLPHFETFTSNLKGTNFLDSILTLVTALEKYKDGIVKMNEVDSNSAYCGPSFYVEYVKKKKKHYNYFILEGDTLLSKFSHFFYWLPQKPFKKQYVNNNIVNGEKEAIAAMITLGEYAKAEVPYIPSTCEEGIYKEKIYGSWRLVIKEFNYAEIYDRITFTLEDSVFSERVYKGELKRKASNTFQINMNDSTLIVRAKKEIYKFPIIKITDSCFSYKYNNHIMAYNRL